MGQMRNSLIFFILITTWLCSCGPTSNFRVRKVEEDGARQRSLIHDIEKKSGYSYIYEDTTYASHTGNGITIQNSGPKVGNIEPGLPYVDASGRRYFFAAFWTRIINGTETTMEFEVNFPANEFPLSPPSDPYLKLLIPPDKMTVDKLPLYSYGLTGMKDFVDTNFDSATKLQKTIGPNEEHMFYIITISYQAGGPARASITLKENELFYRISMGAHGPLEIPCGRIALKSGDDS